MSTRNQGVGTEAVSSRILMRRTEDLAKTAAFADLSDDERSEIAALLQEKRATKDSLIFREDTPAKALYIVRTGKVKVFKSTDEGKEQILGIFDRWDMFGAGPVFSGGRYPASAAAITSSELYVLQRADCLHLAAKHPRLTMGAMRTMTERLRQAHELVRDLAFQSVSQRTAGLLLRLAREHGIQTATGMRIDLALSRDELAEMVGTSRETFIRALSRLAKLGAIALDKRSIIIVDEQKLQNPSEI